MTSPTEKCMSVSCNREAVERGWCLDHAFYYGVLLADAKYRTQTPPLFYYGIAGAIQPRLIAG